MNNVKDKIYVVIPAYNEESQIAEIVESTKNIFKNIVVIDDNSQDNTADIAKEAGATVLRHLINLGQGAALQTGFDYCIMENADYVITFDADGQHSVDDAKKMLAILIESDNEIALGSRFLGNTINMPSSRKKLLKLACLYTRLTSGLNLTDSHNGLRALNRNALNKIRITQNRMAHASEILDQISHHQLRYIEVPVTILYTPYSLEKGQSMWNAFPILVDMLVRKFRS